MTTAHDDDQDNDMTPLTARRDTGDHTMTDTSREAVERLVDRLEDRRVCSIAQNSCRNDITCNEAAFTLGALLSRAEAAETRATLQELRADAANAEAERLREALTHYAIKQNWVNGYEWNGPWAPTFAASTALQETTND